MGEHYCMDDERKREDFAADLEKYDKEVARQMNAIARAAYNNHQHRWPEKRGGQLRMFCAEHASTIVVRMVAVVGGVIAGWFSVFLLARWTIGVLYHG